MSDVPSEPEDTPGDAASCSAPGSLEPPAAGVEERPLRTARGALRAMLAADAAGDAVSGPSPSGTDDAAEM